MSSNLEYVKKRLTYHNQISILTFFTQIPISMLPETSENQRFSDVLGGIEVGYQREKVLLN